jgi:hypothetical protein
VGCVGCAFDNVSKCIALAQHLRESTAHILTRILSRIARYSAPHLKDAPLYFPHGAKQRFDLGGEVKYVHIDQVGGTFVVVFEGFLWLGHVLHR